MSRLVEPEAQYSSNDSKHEEFIAECDASDGEYLRITWDEADADWRWLWIEVTNDKRWRTRLKVAWRVLRGKHPKNAAIILNDLAVQNLKEFLWGKSTIEPGLDVYISEVTRLELELEQCMRAMRIHVRKSDDMTKRAQRAEQQLMLLEMTLKPDCPHNDCVLTHDGLVYCNECNRTLEPGS